MFFGITIRLRLASRHDCLERHPATPTTAPLLEAQSAGIGFGRPQGKSALKTMCEKWYAWEPTRFGAPHPSRCSSSIEPIQLPSPGSWSDGMHSSCTGWHLREKKPCPRLAFFHTYASGLIVGQRLRHRFQNALARGDPTWEKRKRKTIFGPLIGCACPLKGRDRQ